MSIPTELDADPTAADATLSEDAAADPTAADATLSEDAAADPTTIDATLSEDAAADPTAADRTAGDPTPSEDPAELDTLGLDDPSRLRAAVEAVLFVSDAALSTTDLAVSLRRPEPEVRAALAAIGHDLDQRDAGIELRELAGGFRFSTRSDVAPAVERFLRDGQRTKLSQAALETLAVVAYRQPVTRGRVAAIRGVSVDGVIRTLLNRGLIAEVGVDADSQAGLYATTDLFLDKIGLSGLDELPSLAPLLPDLDDLDPDGGVDLDAF